MRITTSERADIEIAHTKAITIKSIMTVLLSFIVRIFNSRTIAKGSAARALLKERIMSNSTGHCISADENFFMYLFWLCFYPSILVEWFSYWY